MVEISVPGSQPRGKKSGAGVAGSASDATIQDLILSIPRKRAGSVETMDFIATMIDKGVLHVGD